MEDAPDARKQNEDNKVHIAIMFMLQRQSVLGVLYV